MKTKFLLISCGMLVLASACNNASESKTTATDSAAKPADTTVAAPAPAAEPAPPLLTVLRLPKNIWQQGNSKKPAVKPKKQGTNEVVMYSEPPMPTHEALEQPQPTKAQPAPVRKYIQRSMYTLYLLKSPVFPVAMQL